jgi:hypothetical protein
MSIDKMCMAAAVGLGVFTLVTAPAFAADSEESARAEAMNQIPTWAPYGTGNPDNLQETFFRLQRAFVLTSELGGQRELGSVPLWPRGSLKFGRVRILPYLREAAQWESNFFRIDTTPRSGAHPNAAPRTRGRDGAWTHTNQIGAMADTLLDGGRLRLSGTVESKWDLRWSEEDTHKDDWNFDGALGAAYDISRDVWTSVGYRWQRRSGPIETNLTRRYQETNQQIALDLGHDNLFTKNFKARVGVQAIDVDPTKQNALDRSDRTEVNYIARLSYPFWRETTDLFIQGRYRDENRESDELNDGSVTSLDFGISGAIPLAGNEYGGVRGEVSLGFDHGSYENGTFNRGTQVLIRDEDNKDTSLNVRARLQYIMSPRTDWDLTLFRGNQFSYHGNYQITTRTELAFSHNWTCKITTRAAAFWEHVDPSGVTSQKSALTGYTGLRESGPQPSWDRFGFGFGARYPLEDWLDLDASIDTERKNATPARSFQNYRAIVGLTFYMAGLNPPSRRTVQ